MARPLRIEFPGALYHVVSRGNERRRIVRDDADRTRRLEWLGRTVEVYRWRLHAFVLMTNHEHLLVETPAANLSAGMQHLNGSYTSYFNRRHRRVGHLFQGRFKAHIIESAGHYKDISRYIHLNPVRARIVDRPEEWPWSSYPGYHRASRELPWVVYREVLSEFGHGTDEARRVYRRFVAVGIESMPPCPWEDAAYGLILGGEVFVARVRRLLSGRKPDPSVSRLAVLRPRPTLAQIATATAAAFEVKPSDWTAGRRIDGASRAAAAWLARRRYAYRAREVAAALGYTSHGGVAGAVRRIDAAGPKLRATLQRLEKQLDHKERP